MSDVTREVVGPQNLVHRIVPVTDDHAAIRSAFGAVPSGVSVMAIENDGRKHSMVASSFMVGVSLEPCLMAVAVQKSSESWPHVRNARHVGVSIFGEGQGPLVSQLSSRNRERRFDGVETDTDDVGAMYLDGASMWFRTRIHQQSDAGDHWMILLEVVGAGAADGVEPLLWHNSTIRRIVD